MELPELIRIQPNQTDLLRKAAKMMGTSFMEEMWFITWLSALDEIGTSESRKEELLHAVFMDDLTSHAPYQGVYALPDLSAVTGGYLYSDLDGMTHSAIEEQSGKYFLETATEEELELDWARVLEQENDHIYFYAWAVDPQARGTGALRKLLTPIFKYADEHNLNCYLDCYADRLQRMYEHLGFELIDELHSPDFEVYERRMIRRPR